MNKDSRLYKWARKQQKKMDISEGMSTGFKHRSAFHKEFRGYSELRIPTENGRYKIERVYIAPWYQHNISKNSWIVMKLLFAFGDAAAIALFIIASIQNTIWNYSKVTSALQALLAISMVIVTARIVILLTTPRKMTIGQCDSVDIPLTRWTLITFLMSSIIFIWNIIILLIGHVNFFSSESVTLWLLLPVPFIYLAIWLVQRKMVFIPIENENTVDEDDESYVIQ